MFSLKPLKVSAECADIMLQESVLRIITRMLPPAGLPICLFIIVLLSIVPVSVAAGEAGTSSLTALRVGVGAKPSALGNAYTGVAGEVYAIHSNPAGLATMEAAEFTASHSALFADIGVTYGAVAFPLGDLVLGGALNYVDYGGAGQRLTINGVNPGTAGEELEPKAFVASLAVAKKFTPSLSVGLTAKVINVDLVDNSSTAFAMDAGAIWQVSKPLFIGAAVKNAGSSLKFQSESEDLPLTFSVGASYYMENMPLNFYGDVDFPTDEEIGGNGGIEYIFKDMVALRLGYSSSFDAGNGLTGGIGVTFQNWKADYSIQSTNDVFDNVHRFSLSSLFGAEYKDVGPRSKASGGRR